MATDPVAFLRNAHQRAEELARAAMKPGDFYPPDPIEWLIASNDLSTRETTAAEAHIRANTPDTVLARVAAERQILDACENVLAGWHYGESKELAHDVIVGLAAGWGWTEAS